ncbi:MAG: hypothetical protein GY765_37050, partial [bacterium]|nr:hypothetical protein [bacterium]
RDLPALTSLDLSYNNLNDVSFLRDLPALTSLDLEYCKLKDVSFLLDLPALTSLGLSDNGLNDVAFLRDLPTLTSLDLSDNDLNDVSFLRDLSALTSLNLRRNYLNDVSFLRDLPVLTSLYLSGSELYGVPFLRDLPALTSLDLSYSQLNDVSFLRDLPALTSLYLSYTQLNDVSFLQDLPALTSLSLENNKITDVSFIRHLEHLTSLYLHKNPIENPPPEIVKQGLSAIRDYFKSMEAAPESVQLNEVKVLLVGDGGAGKTSLLKQLEGETFDKHEPKTHGIAIHTLPCPKADLTEPIQAHVWDFGGQEIMHASHQFFLSKRALYILVVNAREEGDPDYWLQHIRTFGGDSPVLVVVNKTDEHDHHLDNFTLKEKYPNIKGFYRTSCADRSGLEEFQKALYNEIPKIELLQTPVAASWMRVKRRLEELTKINCHIDSGQFETVCDDENIPKDTTRETLVRFLNELGIILHFRQMDLAKYHVLNPRWVTEGVYRIINSTTLETQKGVLRENQLDTVINEEKDKTKPMDQEHEDRPYNGDERRYLVKLMEHFQLCFPLAGEEILVPVQLPANAPFLQLPGEGALNFRVQFDFLPRSLVPRLLIRLKGDVVLEKCWRSGMVLENKDTQTTTLVRADYKEKTLSIAITGTGKREYLGIIRHGLLEIHDSFERLEYRELVPLPDGRAVEYSFLVGYEQEGVKDYYDGVARKNYDVTKLLDTVTFPAERSRERMQGVRDINISMDNSARMANRMDANLDARFDARLDARMEQETEVEMPRQTTDTETVKQKEEREAEIRRRVKEEIAALDKEIEGLENRLEHVTGRRAVLDEEARKRTKGFYLKWGILFAVLFVCGVLGAVIFGADWNTWEPWTFVVCTLLVVVIEFFIVSFTGKGFSLAEKWNNRLQANKIKEYARVDFDSKEKDRLEKKLEEAKQRKNKLLKN